MKRVQFVLRLFDFAIFYLWEIFRSNLRVAHDTLTPRHYSKPGIVAVPLRVRSDLEILLLANLISFTPGTLSLDVASDRRVLYVHVMFLDDPDRVRNEIVEQLEGRVLRLLRA